VQGEVAVSEPYCAWFGELTRKDVSLAGGKGANLGDMVQAELPVPPGYVITAPTYRLLVEAAELDTKIDDLLQGLDRNLCEQLQTVEPLIRDLFVHVPVPGEMRRAIVDHYRALGGMGPEQGRRDVPVAVRSSATAEDLAGASFAGQQETCLNVVGEEALLEAVRRCWSSLFTSQAIFYRCQRGFDDNGVSMGVVVQRMVDSEKAGVSFTVDPVLRNPYQTVIEGVWGLGEGIVSGKITPDHYKLDRETYEVVFEFVPDKKIMYKQHDSGGIHVLPVPTDKVSARVLSEDELRYLVDLGNQVEEHFGCPQDIEWGVEGGTIYLLQSRPITSL
jgi:pyruvate,water dikinase